MRFDAVFFDSGGTLFGARNDRASSPQEVALGRIRRLEAALAGMGVPREYDVLERRVLICEEDCRRTLGTSYTFFQLMLVLIEVLDLNLRPEDAACLADAYAGPRYAAWLFPGTRRVIRTLSEQGLHLGVIANTAWPGFCMDRAFAGVGLLPYFATRVYSGDLGIAKPDPQIFRQAEKIAGLKGKRILYVGNSPSADIKGAAGVGWATAFRRTGNQTTGGMADFEFGKTPELLDFVLQK